MFFLTNQLWLGWLLGQFQLCSHFYWLLQKKLNKRVFKILLTKKKKRVFKIYDKKKEYLKFYIIFQSYKCS